MRWIEEFAQAATTTLVGGASLFRKAPLIPLLVVIPEFIQHVVEISLGMFDSKLAFAAGGATTLRMGFGMVKVAGLILAILAAARYLGGAKERWWRLNEIPGKRFFIALALNIGVTVAMVMSAPLVSDQAAAVLSPILTIATLPLLVYLVGPLVGDRSMTLARSFTWGWLKVLAMALLSTAVFWPVQWLHAQNHEWAIGASDAVVWALMIFDSLLVGLLACWTGAALAAGYRFGEATKPQAAQAPQAAA